MDSRDRLRQLGQLDLGDHIEVSTDRQLWSVQHKIATAISAPHARVAVPSCNASGKTHLAARIALAFFDAYTPGTPCQSCDPTGTRGGCRGSKVIATSSKSEHLRDNLFAELRIAYAAMRDNGVVPSGRLLEGDLRLDDGPAHFIIGQAADKAEGMQGYHAAHKLIIGDEATAIAEEVALGITRLMSAGDARQLLIFNPTTADTYAYKMTRAKNVEVIKITAYDTPNFTGEEVPFGANLTSHLFLEDLKDAGMGPGSYEWNTSVEAEFWDQGEDTLIPFPWIEKCLTTPMVQGIRQIGVDLATYGDNENVIAFREGNNLVKVIGVPSVRQDVFWETHVTKAVQDFQPHYLVYDADGVGAGVLGYAEQAARSMPDGGQLIPFRGAGDAGARYYNARSAWWWNLRRRFEFGHIHLVGPVDQKMRDQLAIPKYSVTANGKIKVETKAEMKKRGEKSPDRGDAVMYAFAMSEVLEQPFAPKATPVTDYFGVSDHSEEAMWRRAHGMKPVGSHKVELNPVTGVDDYY
jgi:hypothetical protein